MSEKIPNPGQEALYLLDDALYLHIKKAESGWDYSMYDKQTLQHLEDGWIDPQVAAEAPIHALIPGSLDGPIIPQDLYLTSVEPCDLSVLNQIQSDQERLAAKIQGSQENQFPEQAFKSSPEPANVFQTLTNIQENTNYLKSAEMSMEDDYGMIDGVINNGKADSTKQEEPRRKKESVLAQLREPVKKPIKVKPKKRTKETVSL